MKCTDAAANGGSVEDFGKLTVVISEKTHYNRGCPRKGALSFVVQYEIFHCRKMENSARVSGMENR